MEHRTDCAECPASAECQSLWMCARGRTRLHCRMHHEAADQVRLEVMRNTRLYGMYHFAEKVTALAFAGRLRQAFESNGWNTV